MKINEIQRIGAVNHYQRTNDSKSANSTARKDNQKDEVSISSQAQELLDSSVTGSNRSEAHGKKIDALKQSVSSGTYYVESGKVAERLLPYIR